MWFNKQKSESAHIFGLKCDIKSLQRQVAQYKDMHLNALKEISIANTESRYPKSLVTVIAHMKDGKMLTADAGEKSYSELLDFQAHMAEQMYRSEILRLGDYIAYTKDVDHLQFIKTEVSKNVCQCCCSIQSDKPS